MREGREEMVKRENAFRGGVLGGYKFLGFFFHALV